MTWKTSPTPLKENLGPFIPLRGQDLATLMDEPATRAAYLDALGTMHDVLCELSDTPIHPRSDPGEARTGMRELISQHFAGDTSLARQVRENWDSAETLREDFGYKLGTAEEGVVRSEIASFVSGLLFAYNQVRSLQG